jgi:ABC-type transport system involved in cytochrome c biogenesis permease subunit
LHWVRSLQRTARVCLRSRTLRAPRIWTFLIRLEKRKLPILNAQESFAFLTGWVLSFNVGAE